MLCAYLAGVGINVYQEMNGNPRIDDMGIAQDNGAMEGKEVRLGAGATGLWSVVTWLPPTVPSMACTILRCPCPV